MHYFTLGMDIVLFAAMIWFVYIQTPKRRGHLPPSSQWGPLIFVALGCFLLFLDPIRHLLLDMGKFEEELHMYDDDMGLTFAGRFSQFLSLSGAVSLFLGVFWFLDLDRIFFGSASSATAADLRK